MSHRAQLTIAGVRFAMTCDCDIANVAPSPAYRDFTHPPAVQPDVEVAVTLVPQPVVGLAEYSRQFDADDMWSLFRNGDTRYVTHTGWGIEAPLWSAELQLDASAMRIYCGAVLVSGAGEERTVSSPLRYPLDQILLTYVLARREGLLLHSAGIEYGGQLWLLAGRSGAGKSTAAQLLQGRSDVALLSDDRIVVRRVGETFKGFGTPWPGDARVAVDRQAPLAGILLLAQSSDNRIAPVRAAEAVERLLPMISVPWYEPELFPEVLSFCGTLVESVPTYELQFRPDDDAARMLVDFMHASLITGE
ncbi:MAG: hypothetical protein HQ523_14910 [Lentisphaerae bacterium]|nr:hypothetical protein [Lentisphaerota bacterium]